MLVSRVAYIRGGLIFGRAYIQSGLYSGFYGIRRSFLVLRGSCLHWYWFQRIRGWSMIALAVMAGSFFVDFSFPFPSSFPCFFFH